MSALEKVATLVTIEEYLEGERKSEVRHEYVAGDLYETGCTSRTHNLIVGNILMALTPMVRGKSGDVFVICDPRDTDEYFSDYPGII